MGIVVLASVGCDLPKRSTSEIDEIYVEYSKDTTISIKQDFLTSPRYACGTGKRLQNDKLLWAPEFVKTTVHINGYETITANQLNGIGWWHESQKLNTTFLKFDPEDTNGERFFKWIVWLLVICCLLALLFWLIRQFPSSTHKEHITICSCDCGESGKINFGSGNTFGNVYIQNGNREDMYHEDNRDGRQSNRKDVKGEDSKS